MVVNVVPLGLRDPKSVVKEGETTLEELSGGGVCNVIGKLLCPGMVTNAIFRARHTRRKGMNGQLEFVERAKQLDTASTS